MSCFCVLICLKATVCYFSFSGEIGNVIQCAVKGYESSSFNDVYTGHSRAGIVLNVEVVDPLSLKGNSARVGVIGEEYIYDTNGELFRSHFGFDLRIGSEFSLIRYDNCEIQAEYVIGESADLVYGYTYDEYMLRVGRNGENDLAKSINDGIKAVEISRLNAYIITDCGDLMGSGLNAFNQIGSTEALASSGWRTVASEVEAVSVGANYVLYITKCGDLYGLGNVGGVLLGRLGDDNKYRGGLIAKNITNTSAGANHLLFIDLDGVLWGLGSNRFGKLDMNDSGMMRYDHPVRIDCDVVFCYAAEGETYYVKSDGSLWGLGPHFGGLMEEDSFSGSARLKEGVSTCGIYMRTLCVLEDSGDLVVSDIIGGSYEIVGRNIESFRSTRDFLISKNRNGVLVGTGAVPGHRYQSVGSWVTIADDVLHYSVCDGSLFYVDLGGKLHVFGSHRYLR